MWRKSARRDFSQRLLPRGHAEVSDTDQCELSGKGQTEKNSIRPYVFRFALKLEHCSTHSACLKGATSSHHIAQLLLRLRDVHRRLLRPPASRHGRRSI